MFFEVLMYMVLTLAAFAVAVAIVLWAALVLRRRG